MTSYFTFLHRLSVKSVAPLFSLIIVFFLSAPCAYGMDPEPTEESAQQEAKKTFITMKGNGYSSVDLEKSFKEKASAPENVAGLNLSRVRLYPKQLSVLCDQLPKFTALTHLSLAGNNLIAPASSDEIDMHQLDADTQALVAGLSRLTHLQVLDLSENPLGRFEGYFGAQILKALNADALEELHLHDCMINPKEFCVLGKELKKLTQLKTVSLSKNPILSEGNQQDVIQTLNTIFESVPKLKKLNMGSTTRTYGINFPMGGIAFPANLESLSLSHNDGMDVNSVSSILRKSPQLKTINFDYCKMYFGQDSDAEKYFWSAVGGLHYIERVFISNNSFFTNQMSFTYVAEQINKLNRLKTFCCSLPHDFDIASFEALVQTLGDLPSLEEAYLGLMWDDTKHLRAYQLGQKKVFLKDYKPSEESGDKLATYFQS